MQALQIQRLLLLVPAEEVLVILRNCRIPSWLLEWPVLASHQLGVYPPRGGLVIPDWLRFLPIKSPLCFIQVNIVCSMLVSLVTLSLFFYYYLFIMIFFTPHDFYSILIRMLLRYLLLLLFQLYTCLSHNLDFF